MGKPSIAGRLGGGIQKLGVIAGSAPRAFPRVARGRLGPHPAAPLLALSCARKPLPTLGNAHVTDPSTATTLAASFSRSRNSRRRSPFSFPHQSFQRVLVAPSDDFRFFAFLFSLTQSREVVASLRSVEAVTCVFLRVGRHVEPQDAAIRGAAGCGLTAGAERPSRIRAAPRAKARTPSRPAIEGLLNKS